MAFRTGTPSSPSSARIRESRNPRDRARVRPEERRPRRAEAHPARTRRRRHHRKTRQEDPRAGSAAADGDGRHHRPRQRRRTDRHARPNGTRSKAANRRKSASIFRAGRSRAPRPASATARCCAIEKLDEGEGAVYRGRVIKVIDHAKTRVLGIFRDLPDGGGRLVPVDKKQAGRELNIAKADSDGAEDGDLVSVDLVRSRGFGLASGKVKERLGSLAIGEGGQPDRDPRPRNSAGLFARRVARGRRGKAGDAAGPRRLARRCRW